MNLWQVRHDFNSAAFWAGISALIFMVFGALTVQVSVIEQLGVPQRQATSWIVITWLTPFLVSVPFIIRYRQPLVIGWTLPGLVYMGSLAGRFSFEEIVGANLLAGLAILVLGRLRAGRRIMGLVPMPILMGMFAASILGFVTQMVEATAGAAALGGPMVAAYALGRWLAVPRIPPVGLAVVVGAVMVALLGDANVEALELAPPALALPGPTFSVEAVLTVSLPMVVLVLGLGNMQGLGYLAAQGYRVPADGVTMAVGAMSMVNALFGGHPASMTRVASAMAGGPGAGPLERRYWAALVAVTGALGVVLATGLIVAAVSLLPSAYVTVVAGLAILASFEDAMVRAFSGPLRTGSTVAFGVGLSSLLAAGIPAAFWALVAGVVASLLLERDELLTSWRRDSRARGSEEPAEQLQLVTQKAS